MPPLKPIAKPQVPAATPPPPAFAECRAAIDLFDAQNPNAALVGAPAKDVQCLVRRATTGPAKIPIQSIMRALRAEYPATVFIFQPAYERPKPG